MTRDQVQSVHDDIAYMKALAQEGRQAPLLAGPVMVAAAIVFGLASVAQWVVASGLIDVTPWAQFWIWVVASAIFVLDLAFLTHRMKNKPGASSVGNRAVGAAWTGVGFGIFVTWLALMVIGFKTGDWFLMNLMPTIVVVAYGSAWMVAAFMSRARWMMGVALTSYAGAVVLAWFAGDQAIYLVHAILLLLVAFIPGLILMRQEPAEVV
nr:hypothetical protein [Brevundimonas diminuta]